LTESDGGLTVKELVLRLEGKIDAFIIAHEIRHQAESDADYRARSDPTQSAAGRALDTRISTLSEDVDSLAGMVRTHERTLQRLIGASVLLTTLGIGTLGLLITRISGILPQ
jgi:hypothetical protein